MKFCSKCGAQLDDEAVFCPTCGAKTDEPAQTFQPAPASAPAKSSNTATIRLIAKIFMLLGCISLGAALIPLCWAIPMTVHYWNAVKYNRPVGIAFKICSLIFVSTVAGILMLIENEDL